MTSTKNTKLSRREREIMDVLHSLGGRASAEDIRQGLTDPPSYSAVRAMLVKLEAKGQIQHNEEGLKYVYTPTESRTTARRRALDQLIEVFFAGSPGQAVATLLKQEKWTPEELDELHAEIEAAREKRR
ncbi:MAG: BlaI/MecI/CopY family transcriptional regulator [Chloracidobacterium sp.]|nr:BlaI/MecI/CopY family transcriptional regulator [Chloracidobacterium sp.]